MSITFSVQHNQNRKKMHKYTHTDSSQIFRPKFLIIAFRGGFLFICWCLSYIVVVHADVYCFLVECFDVVLCINEVELFHLLNFSASWDSPRQTGLHTISWAQEVLVAQMEQGVAFKVKCTHDKQHCKLTIHLVSIRTCTV